MKMTLEQIADSAEFLEYTDLQDLVQTAKADGWSRRDGFLKILTMLMYYNRKEHALFLLDSIPDIRYNEIEQGLNQLSAYGGYTNWLYLKVVMRFYDEHFELMDKLYKSKKHYDFVT